MGIYNAKCSKCSESFVWRSHNEQVCGKCKPKKEDASTNSLGAMPTGRLINPGKAPKKPNIKKLIDPLLKQKGECMSLAKKYLGILFEEDQPAGEAPPAEMSAPEADAPPVDGNNADLHDEEDGEIGMGDHMTQVMEVCKELEDVVMAMEDGEQKDKLMEICGRLKGMCDGEEEEEDQPEESMAKNGKGKQGTMGKKAKKWSMKSHEAKKAMMHKMKAKSKPTKLKTHKLISDAVIPKAPANAPVVEDKVYPWSK